MKKIAFLFLVLDNPNFPKLWDSYFKGHSDKYTIYIHPKYKSKCTWKKKNVIKNIQDTEWGFITRAYIELMQEAYKDKTNYKFVTISESCIPIKSFDNFYNDVMNDNRSWVKRMNISNYDYTSRIITQKTLPFPKHIIKHYARFCLNRDHVKILLSKSYELEFFHNMQVGDEFFLSVLYPFKNSIKNFNVTYDDWDYIDLMKRDLNNKIKNIQIVQSKLPLDKGIEKNDELFKYYDIYNNISKSPKTILDVREDLNKIKSCDSYFYRKFSKDSNIENYYKIILK
jgi:hypothetical protein